MTGTHSHDHDVNQLTSDEAIWSHLVGKPVQANIKKAGLWSVVTLAHVTESFLIFQVSDDDVQHVRIWRHDHVRSIDLCRKQWKAKGQIEGFWKQKYVDGAEFEIFGSIELDHNTPAVIENKKRGGGGGVGVGFAVPAG
jgi:hypothetical protein